MKFIDSIDYLKTQEWIPKHDIIISNFDEMIQNQLESIDTVHFLIEQLESQILNWKRIQEEDNTVDLSDKIKLLQLIVDFYRINGRLELMELDINTAYKNLFVAKTDYEYRFFARRIYTLLYESNKGLAVPVGQMIPKLIGVVDEKHLMPYKNAHKCLVAFLNSNDTVFKDVRNSNEAHKYKDFEIQLSSIENISVVKSISIIQESIALLTNINATFLIIQGALTNYLEKLLKV